MAVNDKINELEGKLNERRKGLADIFAEAGPDMNMDQVKSLSGDSAAKVDEIRTRNAEIDGLAKQLEDTRSLLKASEEAMKHVAKGEDAPVESQTGPTKSFGELFTGSEAFKVKGRESNIDINLKTLFETTAGWAPETTRTGLLVDFATRPIQVTDLIPSVPTSQAAYVYMEETTFTNAAAERAEGVAFPEAALALTERTSPVRKVAVWIPVTDEQLEDVSGASAYVNGRLPFMLRQRLDQQILTGDGNAPNLRGVNNVVGIQTEAKGANPVPDAVHRAITKVRVVGRAAPNAVVMHPNDWQDVRLLRTNEGIYIWGSPSEAGTPRIWGLPVVQSDAQTENTAVVGDFANYSLLANRRGIDVQVSNSHASLFIEGKQAIRADLRVAVAFLRPTAFCTVTGI
jgi:HK97 family phage major capsid protein